MTKEEGNKAGPPYLMGLLGIIPLVGAFVGIALILYGVLKYKDKLLVIIGSSAVIFTVLVYTIPFYWIAHSTIVGNGYAKLAQTELNGLANQIEFYKYANGAYPDSLEQLLKADPMINIADPLLLRRMKRGINIDFHYEKLGERYTLFSVGIDGVPHTSDDIYPVISDSVRYKYGFMRK